MDFGEVQCPCCEPEPGSRRGLSQLLREPRAGQVTGQHLPKSQFSGENVGGDPGHIANFALNLEPPILGGYGPVQDFVKVSVDDVDLGAADREPGPAVHDAAPLARGEDPARPAERGDISWVDPVPVVQAEVPVRALDSGVRRSRPSEGDRHHPGDRGQLRGEMLHATSIAPPLPRPAVPRPTGPALEHRAPGARWLTRREHIRARRR